MKRDQYQFRQGREYAADALRCAASTMAEQSLLTNLLANLRKNCANKPPSFADGIMSIVADVEVLR